MATEPPLAGFVRGGRRLRSPTATFVAVTLLAGVAAVLLHGYDPAVTAAYPRCPFLTLTGFYCPGCGSSRTLHALLHGRPAEALSFNPLVVACVPFLLGSYLSVGWEALSGRRLRLPPVPSRWLWALAWGIVAFGVLRNLPGAPFVILSPGGAF